MNIVLAASEAFPFCKTGGLADVTGSLAKELSKHKGNRVILFLPHYRNINRVASLKVVPGTFLIPIGDRLETASLSYISWGNVLVFFINNTKYFDRPELYRTAAGDYFDNDERFIFFNRAVLESCKFIGYRPDIIHAHDWQAGLLPAYLKTVYKTDAFFTRTRSLFTIHNMAYQGQYPYSTFIKTGFHTVDYVPERFEYYGGISYLKSGIVYADYVNTVSPNYAKEITLDEKMGFGMEGLLRSRQDTFCGILNGLDTGVWDPEHDPLIPYSYESFSPVKGKAACKQFLQNMLGLEVSPSKPLVGIVSRMDYQKGLDLIPGVVNKYKDKVQFVVVGTGDSGMEKAFMALAKNNVGKVAYVAKVDEELAHRVYAGSDIFLMPSRFEPCGLSQMISMRYGTVPIVSRVGGLLDTVKGYDGITKYATGFFILEFSETGIERSLDYALKYYQDKRCWGMLIKNGMEKDFSWTKSAQEYQDLYKKIISK
ncbi:Glycogen/starch synthase, ADP-glucose type [Elusimicrobium minutum Pei191]|uniref:Glycogen synthase n=1 Tax=Elusimicrobium minutum (strain Pei191) TaxID=445932 RepID=GLGA_ELUMP|nr:glycogen/starch synthase [Elusimicrobium minutum]B2KE25.1 RecName: Full=Glycogen synthase; AltName: Full=Starch [bacterial glycogen] synthase [Elusimicrobium minutum Pei191]ACC98771.1 Glycogen/starch synthase, ADP-glucose type [Elusimicrobium minutum Pei191]